MDSEKLIEVVKSRRTLWDIHDNRYLHRDAHKAAWKEVAEKLRLSVHEVKKRWRSLRDTFRRELKKCGDDDDTDASSKWLYFKQLQFLKDSVQARNLTSNTLGDCPTIEDYTVSSLAEAHLAEDSNPHRFFSKRNFLPSKRRKVLNKRKYQELSEDESSSEVEKKPKYSESDDDYQFLISLLPFLKDVPKPRKLVVRSKLQQVFIDEVNAQPQPSTSGTPARNTQSTSPAPGASRAGPSAQMVCQLQEQDD